MNPHLTKKNQIGKKYYCPNCKLLFAEEDKKYYECKDLVKGKQQSYICLECSEPFTNSTYKNKSRNREDHHFGKNSDKNKDVPKTYNPEKVKLKKKVENHISNIITDLWEDGYNINEIHTHTHFPETPMKEVIQDFKKKHQQEYTFDEFNAILDTEMQDKNYILIPDEDKRTHKIRRALQVGCSVKHIATIMGMRNNKISKARRISYVVERASYIAKLKEELKEDKTMLDIVQEDIQLFLKNTISTQDSKATSTQRGKIEIDMDKQIITIKGMTEERKKEFEKNIICSPHTD